MNLIVKLIYKDHEQRILFSLDNNQEIKLDQGEVDKLKNIIISVDTKVIIDSKEYELEIPLDEEMVDKAKKTGVFSMCIRKQLKRKRTMLGKCTTKTSRLEDHLRNMRIQSDYDSN